MMKSKNSLHGVGLIVGSEIFRMIPMEKPIRSYTNEKLLSVLSFNILGDSYAHNHQFPNLDRQILDFNNRSKLIVKPTH